MRSAKFLILVLLLTFFHSGTSFANTVELQDWKEGLKECAKDSDGFWIDILVDESSSMQTNDPKKQSFPASYALIEEIEAKLGDLNSLNKDVYLNLYAYSGTIRAIYSTGLPVTSNDLKDVPNLKWTYTGDGTNIDIVFAQLFENSSGNTIIRDSNANLFKTPELGVSSRDLKLCHVGLVITDAAFGGYDGYQDLVNAFLSSDDSYLLVGYVGGNDSAFNSLNNIVSKENGLAIKIDDLNNIFLLWEEVIEVLDTSEDIEGEMKVAEDIKIEICDENTVATVNNNCSYTLTLEAFADKYNLFGGVRDQNKQPSNLDGLVLKITGPNSTKGTDIPLSDREEQVRDIQGVSFTVDPGRSKFKISLTPTSKEYRDFVGDWKFQIYSENPINNRYVLMDEKIYGELKAYLTGPDSATPFIEACYDLKLEKLNDGSIFNEADFEVDNVNFIYQNENGGDLVNIATVQRNGLEYCFTFNEKYSNTSIYIKPDVSVIVNSSAGSFDFNTTKQETKVNLGFIPAGIKINNFENKLLRSTAALGDVTINSSDEDGYSLVTEAPNSLIFLDCLSEWIPVGTTDTSKPKYGFVLNIDNQEVGCGQEVEIQNPGTYSFNFVLDVQEIFEGKGDLKLEVSIFDTTYSNDNLVGKAQFIQPVYFVPFSSKILWVFLVLTSVIGVASAMNFLLMQSQKGFTFPQNKQAITFEINKNTLLDEFTKEIKMVNPINLPREKLRSKEINGITFSAQSGSNKTSKIYLNSSGSVYCDSKAEPSQHVSKNEFIRDSLFIFNIDSDQTAKCILFINTSTQVSELDFITLYENIITKFLVSSKNEDKDKNLENEDFSENDFKEKDQITDDFSDDDFSDDDFSDDDFSDDDF